MTYPSEFIKSGFIHRLHQESGDWVIYGQYRYALDNRPIAYYLVIKSGKPRKTPVGKYYPTLSEALAVSA